MRILTKKKGSGVRRKVKSFQLKGASGNYRITECSRFGWLGTWALGLGRRPVLPPTSWGVSTIIAFFQPVFSSHGK
jgi:hypothetical protein